GAVKPGVAALAQRGRRLTPAGVVESLERRINAAGAQQKWPIERVLAGKFVLTLVGLLLGAMIFLGNPDGLHMVMALAFVTMGYFLPDIILYNDSIKRG